MARGRSGGWLLQTVLCSEETPINEGVVNSLPVFKSHDPGRTILCFRHQAPQGRASIRLTALFQWLGQHAQDPGLLDTRVFLAHHIQEVGRRLQLPPQSPPLQIGERTAEQISLPLAALGSRPTPTPALNRTTPIPAQRWRRHGGRT